MYIATVKQCMPFTNRVYLKVFTSMANYSPTVPTIRQYVRTNLLLATGWASFKIHVIGLIELLLAAGWASLKIHVIGLIELRLSPGLTEGAE